MDYLQQVGEEFEQGQSHFDSSALHIPAAGKSAR